VKRREKREEQPELPDHLRSYDPERWCCERRWEAACAEWLLDHGGSPFGRCAGGTARRLPLLQRMVGTGPLTCNCARGA